MNHDDLEAAPARLARERLQDTSLEWLEADGLGGFASGTPSGVRTRRYHGLLNVATTPPTGRMMLVGALEVWVETPSGTRALGSHAYVPDVVHPDGRTRLVAFEHSPLPRWEYRLEDGTRIEQRFFLRRGQPLAVLAWRLIEPRPDVRLFARPLLSGRDMHALHRENAAFRTAAEIDVEDGGERVRWTPYDGVPSTVALANGTYSHAPEWYRNFLFEEERARGFEHVEDLASPGVFEWNLSGCEAHLILGAEGAGLAPLPGWSGAHAALIADELEAREREERGQLGNGLERAATAYLVQRGSGRSVIAGYPWFTDWGRDTFIALRGLCLATGRLDDARSILLEWSRQVEGGMLPNRFVDHASEGVQPEYHTVDAPLWFTVCVHELTAAEQHAGESSEAARAELVAAVDAILTGFHDGARFGIRADEDGLLACGEPGWQLTWMDAVVGERVITPRIGKPVEIQALWINALAIGATFEPRWKPLAERAAKAFGERFWSEEHGWLFDVVDCDHVPGTADASLRPNQILAIGGLPFQVLAGERARKVVDVVQRELWTPLGPRSLAPGDPRYAPHYVGGPLERDSAYHQGTVWPWLAGPFVEAWLRVRRATAAARQEARSRFLEPLLAHVGEAGLGHVSEIADGDAPHTPRGCPFQAWSLGELLRLDSAVLAQPTRASRAHTLAPTSKGARVRAR